MVEEDQKALTIHEVNCFRLRLGMVFLFVIGPCLLMIGLGALAFSYCAGFAVGIFARSSGLGALAGLFCAVVTLGGGAFLFFKGFAGGLRPGGFTLYGYPVWDASVTTGIVLAISGAIILLPAILFRVATREKETLQDEQDSPPSESRLDCADCGVRLTRREQRIGVCDSCRRN